MCECVGVGGLQVTHITQLYSFILGFYPFLLENLNIFALHLP